MKLFTINSSKLSYSLFICLILNVSCTKKLFPTNKLEQYPETASNSNGAVIYPDGSIYYPDGSVRTGDGVVWPAGTYKKRESIKASDKVSTVSSSNQTSKVSTNDQQARPGSNVQSTRARIGKDGKRHARKRGEKYFR